MTLFSDNTAFPIQSPPVSTSYLAGSNDVFNGRKFRVSDFATKNAAGCYGFNNASPSQTIDAIGTAIRMLASTSGFASLILDTNNGAGHKSRIIHQRGAVNQYEMGVDPANDHSNSWYLYDSLAAKTMLVVDGNFRPGVNNSMWLGAPGYLWSEVYSANPAINTSDERLKVWIGPVRMHPEMPAYRRAARRIEEELGLFQWADSVEAKGERDARWHFGVRAQQVIRIFMEEGLEAEQPIDFASDVFIPAGERPSFRHALFCFDTWERQESTVYEERPTIVTDTIEDMVVTRPAAPGKPARMRKVKRGVQRTIMEQVDTGRKRIDREAGNRFGLRPDHLYTFLLACGAMERREMEGRLAAIEARIAA